MAPQNNLLPAYTVVIPAYNAEKTIRRAVVSCLNQSLPPARIIVIDDGSLDQTANEATKLDCNLVEVIKVRNGGVAKARNLGASKAQNDWVAFLDADDYWLPEKMEAFYSQMKKN